LELLLKQTNNKANYFGYKGMIGSLPNFVIPMIWQAMILASI
jgi:hypothetical protein